MPMRAGKRLAKARDNAIVDNRISIFSDLPFNKKKGYITYTPYPIVHNCIPESNPKVGGNTALPTDADVAAAARNQL